MTLAALRDELAATMAAAGVEGARREARHLVVALAGGDPLLAPDRALDPALVAALRDACQRRARGVPFAYIVGHQGFFGLELAVDRAVLIPRPETEGVVELALRRAPASARVADLCTGSLCIAAALAVARPDLRVDATDISPAALAVAAGNRQALGLTDRVRLFAGDLWAALPPEAAGYDLATANPPYVDAPELAGLAREVRDHEPRIALVPPEGWRALYGRLAAGAGQWLRPGGHLICEVGLGQADTVAEILARAGLFEIAVHPDLAGIPRVVEGRRRL